MRLDDAQLADAVNRLWWQWLCDFWQLKWHYERADEAHDDLFASSSSLLAWWSEHLPAVHRAFLGFD
jgi:hypothetical protein